MTLPNKSRQGFGEAWSTAVGRQRRRGQTLLPVPRPGPRALSRLREGESSPGTSQSPAEVWGACEAMASHRDARLPPSRLPRSPPGRRSLRGQGAGTRWGGAGSCRRRQHGRATRSGRRRLLVRSLLFTLGALPAELPTNPHPGPQAPSLPPECWEGDGKPAQKQGKAGVLNWETGNGTERWGRRC